LPAARSALRTRGALALENLALRQQLAVLRRRCRRPPLDWTDRLFWVALSSPSARRGKNRKGCKSEQFRPTAIAHDAIEIPRFSAIISIVPEPWGAGWR
jgi:hypothetical protein